MNVLKPKKGHKLTIPCCLKMKILKFLVKAYEIDSSLLQGIDFSESSAMMNQPCDHSFNDDVKQKF